MNKNDEQLISKFMQANKQDVADNGFSRRVMRRLPIRAKAISDILTAICVVASCILFYVFDGAGLIYEAFESFLPAFRQSSVQMIENLNFQTLIPILAVITYLGIQKAEALSE